MKKKKLKLKSPYSNILRVLGYILCVLIALFLFYRYEIRSLIRYNYSEKASKTILFSFKKDDVLGVGENKTLNAAFESEDYKEKNFEKYTKIEYQKQEHLIKNINKLIKIGYTNDEISTILAHGSDKDVSEFTKKDKVRYIDEFYSFDFAKLSLYDRYLSFSEESGESDLYTVIYINLNLDKEPYKDYKKVDKFSYDMLVNKYNKLDEKFVPDSLCNIDNKYSNENDLQANRVAYNAFIEMYNAIKKEDLEIKINSAYRSYDDQQDIVDTYMSLYGENYIEKYVALAGFSEHQTGLAFDLSASSNKTFASSKEFEWMSENAYKYGFVHRFDKENQDLTGFNQEAWHYRYVGKKIAKYMYENNICFEEYYARFLDK